MNEQTKEGIEISIKIPVNTMKPTNGRIYAVSVDPKMPITAGGIILPTVIDKEETSGGQRRVLRHMRYFVIDFADDVTVKGLTPGIEIFPFYTKEAIGVTYPYVIDWDNNGQQYIVFHESEIAGVSKTKPQIN